MLRRLIQMLLTVAVVAGPSHVSAAPAEHGPGSVLAAPWTDWFSRWRESRRERDHDRGHAGRPRPRSIPELDPATAGAIAAIVAGGGVLIARRRKR